MHALAVVTATHVIDLRHRRAARGLLARVLVALVASSLVGCGSGVISAAGEAGGATSTGTATTSEAGSSGDDAGNTTPGDDATSGSDASTTIAADGTTDAPTTTSPPPTDASTKPPPPDAPATVTCTGTAAGAYCGGDEVTGGDPNTLYQCPGAGKSPTSSTPCSAGCQVNPPGTADACKSPVTASSYKLPWKSGVSMQLTQDCNDSCCSDHVGNDEYAWDWANGGGFTVVAARGGTITHLKINSTTGCGASSCVNDANIIVIDHGDGTQSTYLHLAGMTLAGGVSCGAAVSQGQALATSGTTGWSTGIHLHFQVSKTHPGVATCECGSDGAGCSATSVPWGSFWVTSTYPTVPIAFDEWPDASSCANRRITMPASTN